MAWTAADLGKVGLQEYWVTDRRGLDLATGEHLLWVRHLQENVYCLTDTNRLIALDAQTGIYRWAVQVAPHEEKVFFPRHAANVMVSERTPGPAELIDPLKSHLMPAFDAVVINTTTEALLINRKTGVVVRRLDLEHGATNTGATDGLLFYAGSAKGIFYAVNLQQGLTGWSRYTGDAILAPVEYSNGMVYVAARHGSVHVARAGTSVPTVFERAVGGSVTAHMSVDNRGCFVPCEDNFLYAFAAELSDKLWDHPFACRKPLRDGPQVGDRTVFQLARGDKFYAINLVSGQERWSLPQGLEALAIIGEDAYVRAAGNRLMVVQEIMGTPKESASLGGYDLFSGNATEPQIFLGWSGGRVACLRPLAASTLMIEKRP
jgi:hypothetical protein